MIKAALLKSSPAWENMLIQLGFCCEILDHTRGLEIPGECRLIIINDKLEPFLKEGLESNKLNKTAIIAVPESSRTAVKEDLKSEIEINGEKYYFDQPLVFYKKSERICKNARFLPFSLKEAYNSFGVKRKQFYARHKEFPSEKVRKINLSEVFRFVRNFIVDALEEKKLQPELYSPLPENKPLFIFRIDTDFALERDIMELYNLCRKHNISASWFVDVKSEKMITAYTDFEGQEIALHCDRHYVYKKQQKNESNIVRANQILLKAGIAPRGFAAPFGDWNTELEKVLFAHEYLYSSEFAFCYNGLPVIRYQNDNQLLQIPIHPVSPSRLRRSHFSETQITDYFLRYLKSCREREYPAIIYHHPSLRLNSIIPKIFEYANENKFNNLTMENYAAWWLNRKEQLCRKTTNELFPRKKLTRDLINYPADYSFVYRKSWRFWLQELESWRSRAHFKKYGYPKYIS